MLGHIAKEYNNKNVEARSVLGIEASGQWTPMYLQGGLDDVEFWYG